MVKAFIHQYSMPKLIPASVGDWGFIPKEPLHNTQTILVFFWNVLFLVLTTLPSWPNSNFPCRLIAKEYFLILESSWRWAVYHCPTTGDGKEWRSWATLNWILKVLRLRTTNLIHSRFLVSWFMQFKLYLYYRNSLYSISFVCWINKW